MGRDFDSLMMRRAVALAMRGRGGVEPNPMVGCVIARDGRVLAEAWHERFGGPHAEAAALSLCGDKAAGSTAYVTLEPCAHENKKTPPCAPRLIHAGVGRVVIGCIDPNPDVSGRGITQLRQAGVTVEISPLEAPCRQLIAPFVAKIKLGRPYVTLKWAQSADGRVAGAGGRRVQIGNPASMAQVHALRARSDAILIGSHTALNDDPLLTARHVDHARPLIRIVLDSHLRISETSQLVRTALEVRTWLYCSAGMTQSDKARRMADGGLDIRMGCESGGRIDLSAVLKDLAAADVTHLLVEPGPILTQSFIEANLANRAWIFRSPIKLDEPSAPSAVPLDWPVTAKVDLKGDILTEYLNPASAVFFDLCASADVALARGAGITADRR